MGRTHLGAEGSLPSNSPLLLRPVVRPPLLEEVLGRMPFGVCVLDAELRIRWANQTFASFVRADHRSDFLGAQLEHVLEDPLKELVRLSQEALEAREARTAGEWEHASGSEKSTWRWLLLPLGLSAMPLMNEAASSPTFASSSPVPEGLLAVGMDITDLVLMRSRSEELAAEAGQRAAQLDATFNALTEGVIIYDAAARPVYANQVARQLLGVEPLDAQGTGALGESRVRVQSRPPSAEHLPAARALRGETVVGEKMNFTTSEGDDRVLLVSAAPIILEGRIQGGVSVAQDVTERERLLAERQESERLAQALNQINLTLSSTLEHEEILQRVVVEAAEAMRCDSAALDTREGDAWLVRYGYRLPADLLGRTFKPSERSFITEAARTQRVVPISDAYDDPRTDAQEQRRYHIPSILVAPVVVAGETEAQIFFNYHSEKRSFSEAEIEFAENLAALLGLAMRNAALYRSERALSSTLQEALLRVSPRLPGVEYGHLHRSATAGANVGGDFYDLFPMVDWRVGLLIGDVSGKGVEASALASLAKNAMKAYLHEDVGPAKVLSKTNALLVTHSPSRSFVTAFLGVLDLRTGRLTYSFAGHPPAILRRSSGDTLPLAAGSLILGVFEEAEFPQARARLDPGDILLLYTDGVIEARGDEDFFGEERLLQYLRDTRCGARELPERLLDEVMEFAHGRLTDDLAVMSLTRVKDWSPASSAPPDP